ncbi:MULTISPECIES: 5-methyltetrahydropteroyltriglutamate--homocysteine S-methyltransferase [unclassified Roseofilum]|uniref:5-methyltetrahydropteroyltriglutamate-- homocysteine S-methyltransferase n=1 Tax=unclassified Roseofilum TaxID=2620099 RepID=UPI000E9B576B|nr:MULTISPECIES: 5-methyltetrahydropteroyltriglutamate--homocysteine S-methyltransferase [unclassified Roseofilum]MBP0011125.1 5-methyltetrahydropteroyltriglutamate--homocysteine S-methyltransferase [Roseofilum sp. Belize Diploria]MBP0035794.1 5-methyltetrahydropteroyltriglutamate--homocysteine S-methyltransferase [Roseofilum sp. Belize BBD 4]HBQ97085.1 5-methyltetrahydropteroyltriglutamate--homocysteine S-methyltransferase [Cyanobacteria bacterium UBA11691]
MTITTQTLGYPRIGKKREVKKAQEAFWRGKSDEATLRQTVEEVEMNNWKTQLEAGIDRIGVGDGSLYDLVLDWSVRLGIIPERFQSLSGIDRYFAMARGKDGSPALEMTKWFDTNYHYLVPEITQPLQDADFSDYIATVQRAQSILGDRTTPLILGPLTLLRLSRLELDLKKTAALLCDRYLHLLQELKTLGVSEVQIQEPALVLATPDPYPALYQSLYSRFAQVGLPVNLVTTFDDLGEAYDWVTQLPVSAISLDFTRGKNLELLKDRGFPSDKRLGVGLVDARNIWKIRPEAALSTLLDIQAITSNFSIQPSASLQFVPYDATLETKLPEALRNVLSFARQKLEELVALANAANTKDTATFSQPYKQAWQAFEEFNQPNSEVQAALKNLSVRDFQRSLDHPLRLTKQVQLPPLPTTTIGSFPQTKEVRQLRVKVKRGELSEEQYQEAIDAQIAECIKLQEEIGLDVLVHGEFERTDMVEYFGQKLEGFAFTVQGWVQSYGSRCVRPPIIYGDVSRPQPMTVREFNVAQALTKKPVKGMLTGPITILNWSFPRADISRSDQAFQIALALRQEVADLEAAGSQVIQVDEPALREGLPLKAERWSEYLSWAVDAFRLSTAIARPETQIHTHMCYCEFGDIIRDIENLDADVISIENSRSNNRTLQEVTQAGYSHQIGNGVYDIHSPVVPTTEQLVEQLKSGITNLPTEQIWVNPDCGLKTRRWEEVIPALKNMVKAAQVLRTELPSRSQ